MKITWVTRSFLDYRIPLYKEVDQLCGNQLTVIYFKDVVPERCQKKLESILGNRAIGLSGEIRIGGRKKENQTFANKGGIRIPLRPGLAKEIRKTEPELMLSDGFFQWTYAALLNRALFKIPHVMCYERTLHTEKNVSHLRHRARQIASKYIDAICCNGIETKKYLKAFGYPEDRLFLGNMAADSEGLEKAVSSISTKEIKSLKDKYDLKGSIYLFTGQLIKRKGIPHLLEAWKKFSSLGVSANLVLVGDGDLMDQSKEYISKNNLNSVKLLGRVDYDEICKFYAAADIFIIATLEDNWSLVVPEAMSCKIPIINSKYNGCSPELTKPENGWIFDPLNEVSFEEILNESFNKKEKWQEMGEASHKIVQEFSPKKVAKKIFDACISTLSSS